MRALIVGLLGCASCGPITVEAPGLQRSIQELSGKIDPASSRYLAEQLETSQQRVRTLEEANQKLAAARDKAQTEALTTTGYELELECEAAAGSQSEITTAIDGARASSIGCPGKSGRIALQQWRPKESRLHVELHVGNEAAGYNNFNVRLWHGTENVWTVARSYPMTKTDGCKQGADKRVECAFDDPFQTEPTPPGHVRAIDRQP